MDRANIDIVLVRMDKIGDLVLSLPVDEHPALAGRHVHWLITRGLGFIAEQASPKRSASEFSRRFSPFEMVRIVRWFRRHRPRTVILLHNPWWVSMAAWLACVPERIGRRSQWHSFLFVNLPVRQKRSLSDRHESDFNFDLVEAGLGRLGVRPTPDLQNIKKTHLRLSPPNPQGTIDALQLKARAYRVVHPGMAGSALNWPAENFKTLVEKLACEMPVLITGTKADNKYLQALRPLADRPQVRWMVDQLKTAELLDLLSQARSVIAPSTGVLHLAASLGTPSLGLYSPRPVEHPRRWGPKGPSVTYLLPEVEEKEALTAETMARITPEQVYTAIMELENAQPRV